MSDKQFINDLSATYADIRRLDAKKINLKGKNILEYIGSSTPAVKHAQDTRETVTENDLWGQYIETKSDGTIIVHDDWVTSGRRVWNASITKVEDNKAYVNDSLYGNIQTEKIKDGTGIFNNCTNLTSFTSDLSSLINGRYMFNNCSNLVSFSSDLSILTNGAYMFSNCSQLAPFTSKLSSLTDGGYMFQRCSNLTSFTSDLSSLTNGEYMFFNCSNLESISSDLSSLTNGTYMFGNCSQLTSFSSELSSLTYGAYMFFGCSQLTSFSSELSSLTYGSQMFDWCSNLESFASDLPNLTDGSMMFGDCSQLVSFSSDLSSLTEGSAMFYNCKKFESFSSDLPSLTNGDRMFFNCSQLTSFSSDLSSLTYADRMFSGCSLDAESVMYIADSIKNIIAEKQLYSDGTIPYVTFSNGVYSAPQGFMSNGNYVYTYKKHQPTTITISASNVGKLTLGINVSNDADTIQQQLEDFAKAATFDSWEELKQTFVDKGWTVTFQYGGSSTSIPNTYDLRNGEQIIPCQIFAKLVQAEDKDSAEYCAEDGASFYNIDWGHDVTDTSSYTQFNSLEDAMASWNVFPKENIITTEEEEA